jgi:hypothetical protein
MAKNQVENSGYSDFSSLRRFDYELNVDYTVDYAIKEIVRNGTS